MSSGKRSKDVMSVNRRLPWEMNGFEFSLVIACTLCSFITTFVVTMISTILNDISKDLSVTYAQSICLSEAVSISAIVFSLITIYVCDRYGNKLCTIAGMTILTVSLVASAVSTDFNTMFISRLISGVGIAFVLSSNYSMIAGVTKELYLPEVTAINYAGSSLGGMVGPFIGMALSGIVGWRAMVIALVPLCIVCTLPILKTRNEKCRPDCRIDIPSHILFMAMMTLFLFAAMIPAGNKPAMIVGAAVLLILLIIRYRMAENKLFDVNLLRNRGFTMALVIGFVFIASNYLVDNSISYCIMLPDKPYEIFGTIVSAALLASIFRAIKPTIQMIFSPIITKHLRNSDRDRSTMIGFILMICSVAVFSLTLFTGGYAVILVLFVAVFLLIAFASSIFRPINKSMMISAVKDDERNAASSLYTLVDNMGKLVGTFVIINMMQNVAKTAETASGCLIVLMLLVAVLSVIGLFMCAWRYRNNHKDVAAE